VASSDYYTVQIIIVSNINDVISSACIKVIWLIHFFWYHTLTLINHITITAAIIHSISYLQCWHTCFQKQILLDDMFQHFWCYNCIIKILVVICVFLYCSTYICNRVRYTRILACMWRCCINHILTCVNSCYISTNSCKWLQQWWFNMSEEFITELSNYL